MIYNVYFDIFAVVISFFSIILAFTKKDFWKRQNFILFVLLVATFFASLLDILSSVGNSYIVEWSYGLRDVLNYGYLAVQNVMPYLFCLYIVFLIDLDDKLSRKRRRIFHIGLSIPYVVDVVLLLLNPFMREVFYYDSDRVYTHDWGMIVLYVNALLYMIFNYYLMMRHGKEVRFVKKATVYLFLTASLVAVVFQIIIPTILLQLCIEALCLSGILFTVENENDILHSILLFFFLLVLCFFAEVNIIPDVFPWRMISSIYFLALGVLLVIYFAERIADRGQLKRCMLFCAWLIVTFMLLRMIKYEAFPANTVYARYTWYLYYLPMLFVPLCTFYATLYIDGGEKKEFAKVKSFFGVITFLLFLGVLSNDFHQKVFGFQEGYFNWDSDYTHGFGYFVVIAWTYFLYVFSVVIMFRKCRLSKVKKKWWITMIPFAIGIAMQLLIAFGKMPKINGLMVINFPEAVCFMIALFWECCIRIGLIPTNKGYGELMRVSSLALQITDESGTVIYKSISASELEDVYKKKTEAILLDENTELYCDQISGGYTYWQNDITELNEINKKLEEVHLLLAEETELIRLENELKEKQVSIEQRTKLYELINERTITQSKKIADLAEIALKTDDTRLRNYNAEDIKGETKISTETSKKEELSEEALKPVTSEDETKIDTQEHTPSTEETQSTEEIQPSEDIAEVDNVEDFLEAIQPGATIKIKPGYYNLSDYIEKVWSEQGEEWNKKHPYVELYECWDGGIEVAIQDVQDLSIFADLEGAVGTELVVETRAGAVLNFEDCNNIFLHGLTMGHTQDGACDSSVISFLNTTNVYLTAMDLYGCGMYGFDAMYGSGNIYVQSCTIRDCEDGPFYIMDAQGKYEFRNCWLSGSNGGGYYEPADGAELSFVECNFGEKETNYWYYDEYATFTDCYWEEITEYPDVEPEGEDVLDIDSLIPTDANEWNLADTYYAYMFVNQQSGETEYYPYFTLELYEDGNGWCETEDEYFAFTWYCESDGTVTLESEIYHYLTPYVEQMDGFERLWFMMQMDETVIWLY